MSNSKPFFLVPLFGQIILCAYTFTSWDGLMNESARKMAAGQPAEAETALKNAVKEVEKSGGSKSELAVALIALGDLYVVQKNYRAAESSYKQATETETDDADAFNKLAKILRKQGRSKEASQVESTAKQIDRRYSGINFKPFMTGLRRRINAGWHPDKSHRSTAAVATFVLDRQGNLKCLCLFKSSGVKAADDAALQAVADADPFGALPQGSPAAVYVRFSFDYNVL